MGISSSSVMNISEKNRHDSWHFLDNAYSWYKAAKFMTNMDVTSIEFMSKPDNLNSFEDLFTGTICLYFSMEMACKALLHAAQPETYSMKSLKAKGHRLDQLMILVSKEVRDWPQSEVVLDNMRELYRGYQLGSVDPVTLRYPPQNNSMKMVMTWKGYIRLQDFITHVTVFLEHTVGKRPEAAFTE